MRTTLSIVLLSLVVGCASDPSPRAKAISLAKPIIAALQAYHRETGDYPRQLGELRPRYVQNDMHFYVSTDGKSSGLVYPLPYKDGKYVALCYQRLSQGHYELYLNTPPCSQAVYIDGEFMAGYGPVFRTGYRTTGLTPAEVQGLCGRWQSMQGDTYEFGEDGAYEHWMQTPPISRSGQADDLSGRVGATEGRFSVEGSLLILAQRDGEGNTNVFFIKNEKAGNDPGKFFDSGYSLEIVSNDGNVSRYEAVYR
jgi:hypothetical protein